MMGKCRQKSVWLFVAAMSMADSPSFGKKLLTCILHIILHKKQRGRIFDTAAIVLFLIPFILSPVLNTKNYTKTCEHGDIFRHYSPNI